MENDSQLPETLKKEEESKYVPNNNDEKPQENLKTYLKVSNPKPKKKKKKVQSTSSKEIPNKSENKSSLFSYDEIANNQEASALISDLVKCYTSNSTIPPNELDVVNRILHEKTISVFSNILNTCVEKIYNKLVVSDYWKGLNKNDKQDASCQTSF